MSQYTTEVRWICEMRSGIKPEEVHFHTVDEIIELSRDKIFDFAYPIYDESHRPELEKKILKHYYTREICAETVGRWKLFLNDQLNIIMPAYNKLYEMQDKILGREFINVDIDTDGLKLSDVLDVLKSLKDGMYTNVSNDKVIQALKDAMTRGRSGETETGVTSETNATNSNTGYSRSDTNANSTNKRFYSDTPQGGVDYTSLDDSDQPNESDVWLTDYTKTVDVGHSDTTANTQGTDVGKSDTKAETKESFTSNDIENKETELERSNDHTDSNTHSDTQDDTRNINTTESSKVKEFGYRGGKTLYELLQEYADNIVNIDAMIIRDLADCFFSLW